MQLFSIQLGSRRALTLVEMLVAMAITLVMMAAVTTIFANLSNSVTNRRASMEMTSALRHARGVLHRDLAGATCPGTTWQSPDANHGYIEIIEGPQSDFDPSIWLRDRNDDGVPDDVDAGGPLEPLDLATSTLPSSNLRRLPGSTTTVTAVDSNAKTDGRALGDWDDTLMLTVRNESEPFVGRTLTGSIESTLAEVVWFAVENPIENPAAESFFFSEPGFRTIYRRTLLIAPWYTGPNLPRGVVSEVNAGPDAQGLREALSILIAFQQQTDLSMRVEWMPALNNGAGAWGLVANSLADLTKRENRYEHHGYNPLAAPNAPLWTLRQFPYAAITGGANVPVGARISIVDPATGNASNSDGLVAATTGGSVDAYRIEGFSISHPRPFTFVTPGNGGVAPTVRPILGEEQRDNNGDIIGYAIVGYTTGLVPLSGPRRGEDVMMTDALAFDLKVFDPEAPLIETAGGFVLGPGDEGWGATIAAALNAGTPVTTLVIDRGAFVDLGAWWLHGTFAERSPGVPGYEPRNGALNAQVLSGSVFMNNPNRLSQLRPVFERFTQLNQLANLQVEPYRVWDSWSTHYENNSLDEDNSGLADQGTDGFDTAIEVPDTSTAALNDTVSFQGRGTDDLGERETEPPYDAPLRGVQVTLRAYELDSRQVREVKVSRSFVPK